MRPLGRKRPLSLFVHGQSGVKSRSFMGELRYEVFLYTSCFGFSHAPREKGEGLQSTRVYPRETAGFGTQGNVRDVEEFFRTGNKDNRERFSNNGR